MKTSDPNVLHIAMKKRKYIRTPNGILICLAQCKCFFCKSIIAKEEPYVEIYKSTYGYDTGFKGFRNVGKARANICYFCLMGFMDELNSPELKDCVDKAKNNRLLKKIKDSDDEKRGGKI